MNCIASMTRYALGSVGNWVRSPRGTLSALRSLFRIWKPRDINPTLGFMTCSVQDTRHSTKKTGARDCTTTFRRNHTKRYRVRSEEHTSELQSRENLVCRLLLEKKKKT